MEQEKTGILLIALGHPNYAEMAANLAMSLKHSGCPPIHLVTESRTIQKLHPKKRALFDSVAECPHEACHRGDKFTPFKAKAWMYDLSPFANTLFLDADMLWFNRSVLSLIDQLKNIEWTIQNREYWDLSDHNSEQVRWMWAKVSDLRKHFTQGKLYSLHSELVWFRKTPQVKKYYDCVKELYDNPIIPPKSFAGDIADELCFAIASIITGIYPHATPFVPVYWMQLDIRKGTMLSSLKEKFFGFSLGGRDTPGLMRKKYDMLAKGYAYRAGIPNPWEVKPKRQYLAERKAL